MTIGSRWSTWMNSLSPWAIKHFLWFSALKNLFLRFGQEFGSLLFKEWAYPRSWITFGYCLSGAHPSSCCKQIFLESFIYTEDLRHLGVRSITEKTTHSIKPVQFSACRTTSDREAVLLLEKQFNRYTLLPAGTWVSQKYLVIELIRW